MTIEAALVVNSAGLQAPAIARRFSGLPLQFVPANHFSKGNYYALMGRSPFSRLIYPVPVPGGARCACHTGSCGPDPFRSGCRSDRGY